MSSSATSVTSAQGRSTASLVEATFGERGLQLEARALLSGHSACAWPADEVRIAFVPSALSPTEIRAFQDAPELRIAMGAARSSGRASVDRGDAAVPFESAELAVLSGSRHALERLAAAHPGLLALVAAHHGAVAPDLYDGSAAPRLFGVLNVTPDSFSDGGRFLDTDDAVAQALALAQAGADVIDVGGESTRPGAEPVSAAAEGDRVLPVIERLAQVLSVPISIDTTKAAVAAAAVKAGATLVNDISAARHDPDMLNLVAESGVELVLMHMAGRPDTMQVAPHYVDPVREVLEFLRERVAACLKAGIAASRITVDPGIGFGKRLEDNLVLIRGVPELRSLGLPVLLGVSRKSFLGRLSGASWEADKLPETAAAVSASILFGAAAVRVHDVASMAAAAVVASALAGVTPPARTEA